MNARQSDPSWPGRVAQEDLVQLIDSFNSIRRQVESQNIDEIQSGCKAMKTFLEENRKHFGAGVRANRAVNFALSGLVTRLFYLMWQYSENLSAKEQFITLLQAIARQTAVTVAAAHGSEIILQQLPMQQEVAFKNRIVVMVTTMARKNRQVRESLLQAEILPNIVG